MPRQPRDERIARRGETGRQWGAWLKAAMAQEGIGSKELAERAARYLEPGRAFDKTNVSHWLAGDYGAEADRVIAIARALNRDALPALRAAGHTGIADYAADLRDGAIDALIRRELDAIEDDAHLDDLAAAAANDKISPQEHAHLRADYLEGKRKNILRMREHYNAALPGDGTDPRRDDDAAV